MMIKTVLLLLFYVLIWGDSFSQSNPEKAQTLVQNYIKSHPKLNTISGLKLGNPEMLKSSYTSAKQYKNFQHKIDSLKLEGRKIDARIPKLTTEAEINQSKKDSKNLSDQLVTTSDQLIEFMTSYKGTQIGWMVKTINPNKKKTKIFYLDKQFTRVLIVK